MWEQPDARYRTDVTPDITETAVMKYYRDKRASMMKHGETPATDSIEEVIGGEDEKLALGVLRYIDSRYCHSPFERLAELQRIGPFNQLELEFRRHRRGVQRILQEKIC